jgi:hypothetical protein
MANAPSKSPSKPSILPKSVGPKTVNTGLAALSLLPDIINLVNLFGHGATSSQKQAAAMTLVQHVGGVAVAAVAANNPALAPALGSVVDGIVATKNADGTMPDPAITPTP